MVGNRQGSFLAALILLLVVMFALLATGGDDSERGEGSSDSTTTPAAAAATKTPAKRFCAAFADLGAAEREHLANDTPQSHDAAAEAGQRVLILAPDTGMSPVARKALVYLVHRIIDVPAQPASARADSELEAFLDAACLPSR